MKFKEDARLAYGTERVIERLRQMDRGQILTKAWIAEVFDVRPDSDRWRIVTRKICRVALRKLNLALVAVPTVGYRLATVPEQVNDVMGRSRRAGRQLHRGMKEISATPDDLCSDHERRVKHARASAMRSAKLAAAKSHRIKESLNSSGEVLPKPVLPRHGAERPG